jgi:hypothetical protein
MLGRTLVAVEQTKTDGSRELALLRGDIKSLGRETGDRANQLLGRVDALASHSIQLTGDEMRCSVEQVNQYVRDGLGDIQSWWNNRPVQVRPPTICHIEPHYIVPSKIQAAGTAVLAVRGFGFSAERSGSFRITDEGGHSVELDSSSPYVGVNGIQGLTLNLLRLRNDGKLSCKTAKVSYLVSNDAGQQYSVLAGCDEVVPRCPGGAPMVNGRCKECTFKITDTPGSRLSKMVSNGQHNKNLLFFAQECSAMVPGAEVEVVAGGDVNIATSNSSAYGHWPKWLAMDIQAPGLEARTCSPGSKSYDVEHYGTHSIKLCMRVTVPASGKLPAHLILQRCKQGDDPNSCTLENNFVVQFRQVPAPPRTP